MIADQFKSTDATDFTADGRTYDNSGSNKYPQYSGAGRTLEDWVGAIRENEPFPGQTVTIKRKSLVISIGNSDNKLTQERWAHYIQRIDFDVKLWIEFTGGVTHFRGFSAGDAKWQNAAWIFEVEEICIDEALLRLRKIRDAFMQDSIFAIVCDTAFV